MKIKLNSSLLLLEKKKYLEINISWQKVFKSLKLDRKFFKKAKKIIRGRTWIKTL